MVDHRDLEWDGCLNVRDLGDLPAADGGRTRPGAVVRGDHPRYLTPSGWAALWDYGIRTVVTLETDNAPPDANVGIRDHFDVRDHRPGLTQVRVGIEDGGDAEFMARWAETGLWGTPLYYADALERWPQRHARLVAAVAHAAPGGVLLHCARGCDRTGIAALVLLALAGVAPADIAADYARSAPRLAPREPEYRKWLDATLAERGTSVTRVVTEVAAALDVAAYLRRGGLTDADIGLARGRLAG
ncbi:tyrosine-protein phosphatase [Amorphoplanes digitatis]|uniref:Protein-tyrosine phosphatase n=1 Tax=Actinoplanes digitatis TaxID=1868 RepID=A0A7W7MS68_9ACTN|nr:tyrosine-protein phosphatase [Actinoplanes digitatis]MBB4764437.1 protein-tyrosine phosphatase [Actinoplanes digitatis]BFE73879.1 tyrosine-protein phosphatase [Actinoplanes digitatis]